MFHTFFRATAILVVALFALPLAAAHPSATVVDVGAERCYIYTNDTAAPEFWIESNGVLTGGVPANAATSHVLGGSHDGSGLQRGAGEWGAADTKVDAATFAARCSAP